MFKKIDKFVFQITLADYLLRFVMLLKIENEILRPVIGIISLAFSFVIFLRFFKDKKYTWKYFLGYVVVQSIVSVLLEFMFFGFTMIGGSLGLYLGFLASGIVCAFTGGFLYEYFKQASYVKMDSSEDKTDFDLKK